MTCGKVIIINQGKIQAIGEPRNLAGQLRSAGTARVEMKGDAKVMEEKLSALKAVRRVTLERSDADWHLFVLKIEANKDVRETIDSLARKEQWPLRELSRKGVSLEDVFAELTLHQHD